MMFFVHQMGSIWSLCKEAPKHTFLVPIYSCLLFWHVLLTFCTPTLLPVGIHITCPFVHLFCLSTPLLAYCLFFCFFCSVYYYSICLFFSVFFLYCLHIYPFLSAVFQHPHYVSLKYCRYFFSVCLSTSLIRVLNDSCSSYLHESYVLTK
jgi:hypothetical protein